MPPEEFLKLLDTKLDGVREDLTYVRIDLAHHIKRTDLAEQNLALLRDEFRPIKSHVAMVGAIGKVFGAMTALVGLVGGIAKLMGWL